MKLEDVDEARASWMKLEMVCIQLCQGAVSAWCTDKPCIVDSVPDHMVVVAFQKLAAFLPVIVQEPSGEAYERRVRALQGEGQGFPLTFVCFHASIVGASQGHYSSFELGEHRRGAQSVKHGRSDYP